MFDATGTNAGSNQHGRNSYIKSIVWATRLNLQNLIQKWKKNEESLLLNIDGARKFIYIFQMHMLRLKWRVFGIFFCHLLVERYMLDSCICLPFLGRSSFSFYMNHFRAPYFSSADWKVAMEYGVELNSWNAGSTFLSMVYFILNYPSGCAKLKHFLRSIRSKYDKFFWHKRLHSFWISKTFS